MGSIRDMIKLNDVVILLCQAKNRDYTLVLKLVFLLIWISAYIVRD